MTPDQREWSRTRDELVDAVTFSGFSEGTGRCDGKESRQSQGHEKNDRISL